MKTVDCINNAHKAKLMVPSFNVPYLPMVEPVVRAIVEQDVFALIAVARLEWMKFHSGSLKAVKEEFDKWCNPRHVRLHLDHVPVIDEDRLKVDYVSIIAEAIELGYDSVMVDGSRLNLDDNIEATGKIVEMAHAGQIGCEAELGAVLGHEAGPIPPYEELFASGKAFTRVNEARRFVKETGCDWLSVSVGNIHGAVSTGNRDQKKVQARLNLDLVQQLSEATGIPLVLHGGSGIQRQCVLEAIKRGIAKINIGTEIRQTYEKELVKSDNVWSAQQAVFDRTCCLLDDEFGLKGTRAVVTGS